MAKRKTEGRSLVIVESPAKAKTINKYLGRDYVVKASLGHVRDLPPKEFGIDVSDDFKPSYEVVKGRVKVVSELRRLAAEAPRSISRQTLTVRGRRLPGISWKRWGWRRVRSGG